VTPQYARAIEDIWRGLGNWPMWTRLGWLDIKRRYRRTTVGPFWTAFQLATMVFSVGFLWSALFGQPVSQYMPFLCSGLVVWVLISNIVNEGGTVFTSGQSLLTSIRIPLTLLVATMIWRNIIVFLHNLGVFVIVALLWKVPVNWNTLLFIPGLVILSLNGVWIALLVGMIATRLRDIPQLLSGVLQIMMFLTPVMWSRQILKGHEAVGYIIDFNPLTHLVEVVRTPLLGGAPSAANWIVSAALVVVGGVGTLYLFSRFRQRIPFWL
jgi:ABC-type polysaccharide/polyol phosphate export permease